MNELRVDDVMPHLVERILVGLQLTLVRMDIERDVCLVVEQVDYANGQLACPIACDGTITHFAFVTWVWHRSASFCTKGPIRESTAVLSVRALAIWVASSCLPGRPGGNARIRGPRTAKRLPT